LADMPLMSTGCAVLKLFYALVKRVDGLVLFGMAFGGGGSRLTIRARLEVIVICKALMVEQKCSDVIPDSLTLPSMGVYETGEVLDISP